MRSAPKLFILPLWLTVAWLLPCLPQLVRADPATERWTLLESGDREKIAAELTEIAKLTESDLGVWQWRARAHAALGQKVEELAAWKRVAELDPEDRNAFRATVLGLADLGAAQRAYDLARRHWDWFEAEAQQRLAGSQVAARVRHMELPPAPGTSSQESAEAVLKRLDQTLGKPWESVNWASPFEKRLAQDRLVALNNMARFREAIAFAKTMQEAGVELPGYAQAALGNSLASLNRPGQSLPYLRKAVQENPFDVAAGMQLYYSLIDAGKYREADQHLTEHITRQAYWKGDDFIGETLANEARIQADCARAVGLALGLDPKGAERRLSTLADVAPGSSDLRIAFAEVELIRGRPRAALEEAHQSLALEPEMSSAQAAVLRARTETGDWKGLPAELSRLQERYPFDADVRTASRTWRNETAPRLEMEVTHSRSTAVQSPGKDTVWHSTYRAPGIGEDQDLVMLLEQVSEWGTFPEGDANERRTGATLQKVQKNNRFGLNAGAVDGGTFFGGAFWEWQPLDDWQFEVRAERNSLEAPVRARRGGTTADYYSIGGQKSWFEEGELSWALSWLSYSDGNDQLQVQTDGRRRVWFTPGWELFAGAGLSASRGEAAPDVVYYNPSADLAPEVSMTLHQQIRGDLSQEAKATLGAYFQEGFGPRGFGGLSYRFEWSILQTGSLFAQAQWTTQPFDGTPERSRELQFGFTLLF